MSKYNLEKLENTKTKEERKNNEKVKNERQEFLWKK